MIILHATIKRYYSCVSNLGGKGMVYFGQSVKQWQKIQRVISIGGRLGGYRQAMGWRWSYYNLLRSLILIMILIMILILQYSEYQVEARRLDALIDSVTGTL